ncbi:unnamed protein product [Dimorphilus gyrociliatus]|uniref:CSD domain-containing protein n=1 Tax=Dimorphilus gyrociliatus TaxID=2664684 RepID=A0A7I8VL83_9ANNE|nr:unnamed protein product [Dimorphilus gyrociliatus]
MADWKSNNRSIPPKTRFSDGKQLGIIEKILHSYGFIQCMNKDCRLFFHFSEFYGSDMEVGDTVEFDVAFDKKTSKPIAVNVERSFQNQENNVESRMSGTVATPATHADSFGRGDATAAADSMGSVCYQRGGETFFVPYALADTPNKNILSTGDTVEFVLAEVDNVFMAKKVKLLKRGPKPDRYQGVICTKRDNFGFIERSDVVREIFFHFSEWRGQMRQLQLGADVEFNISLRNGKEVATSVEALESGTVIFEDVDKDKRRGRILKPLSTLHDQQNEKLRQSVCDPLGGRIVYETVTGSIEIPYGDKDQKGAFTLLENDIVHFNIATDRRDQLQRATNITLVTSDTFRLNNEKREKGLVTAVKERYCFLRTAQTPRLFAHLSEVLLEENDEEATELHVGDIVEFTLASTDSPNRPTAQRLLIKPFNSPEASKLRDLLSEDDLIQGIIDVESTPDQPGAITYNQNSVARSISFNSDSCTENFSSGDRVEFLANDGAALLVKRCQKFIRGYVAALKAEFGFIEYYSHDKEIFFHFSTYEGNIEDLELGDDVEFTVSRKGGKPAAGVVRRSKVTSKPMMVEEKARDGVIIRSVRICNPDQNEYKGEIEDTEDGKRYSFCVMSLVDKRDILQPNDKVSFRLATDPNLEENGKSLMAYKVRAIRERYTATVDCLKGQFGFLNYENETGKKLFFHLSDVVSEGVIRPGDTLDFVIVQNKTGRFAASNLRRTATSTMSSNTRARPLRLISRLKSNCEDGPKVVAIRQPYGPDTKRKGFEPRTGPMSV